jgi:hypothetical protein
MEHPVSDRIVSAVAAELDTDPLDLPPLNDAIDVEALEALYASCDDRRCDLELRFVYVGREVTVTEDGVSLDGVAGDSTTEQE